MTEASVTSSTSTSSTADVTTGKLPAYPALETHLLRSEKIKQTFRIQVQRPPVADQTQPLPVVYVTDANFTFEMFRTLSLALQMAQEAPPFILVGIGYPSDSPYAGFILRCRDLTFPPYPEFDVKSVSYAEGELLPEEGSKYLYGGEDFRQFITDDLIPFIDANYATIPDDRTYFGHSGGGYFGLFTLFTDPAVFSNYICASPGLLFHGVAPGGFEYDHYDCGGPLVRDFVSSGRSLDGITLYLSVGEDEEFERPPSKLVASFYDMVNSLKKAAIPGLQVMHELIPGESHVTVIPSAFIHGVQAVFGTRRIAHSFSH